VFLVLWLYLCGCVPSVLWSLVISLLQLPLQSSVDMFLVFLLFSVVYVFVNLVPFFKWHQSIIVATLYFTVKQQNF
jgi:hypothetical protein